MGRGDEGMGGFDDRGAALDGADVALGVADLDAHRTELGERLGDGVRRAHAIDDEIPFFGGELLGDAEADTATTASDESYFGHEEGFLTTNGREETRSQARNPAVFNHGWIRMDTDLGETWKEVSGQMSEVSLDPEIGLTLASDF